MNLTKKISLVLAAVAAAATSYAQTTPAATASTGLLGQRYADVSFGVLDPHGTSDCGFGTGLGVNLPIATNLDASFNYGYSRLNNGGLKLRDHSVNAALIGYSTYGSVKPFFGLGLGYEWSKAKFGAFTTKDDSATWALGAGVEVPAGQFTLTPSVSYVDGFENNTTGAYTYGLEASTWLSQKVAGYVDVSYVDVVGRGGQSWVYTIGARLRF